MKIVHVITRFIRGGADENTLLTCNGQAEIGHDVTLIYGREFHEDMVARLSPKVHGIAMGNLVRPIHPVKDLLCFMELAQKLQALQPDILHTHESKAGIIARIAGRMVNVPIIVHGVHILSFSESPFPVNIVFRLLEQFAGTMTDAFINVSTAMLETGLKARLGRPEQHFVVESGMMVDKYANASAIDWRTDDLLKSIEIEAPTFLLMSGTLEPRKRIDEFVRTVFSKISQDYPNSVLLIAGDGIEKDRICKSIEDLGLNARVFLLGHRADLEGYIGLSDICLHAAMREGLPRVVVQYAIAGKPIVTTALPGIEQLVTADQNGMITPISSVQDMLAPLRQVMDHLEDFSQRAQDVANKKDFSNWDHKRMVDRIESIYQQVIKEKPKKFSSEQFTAAPKGDPSA